MSHPTIGHLPFNPTRAGQFSINQNVIYSRATGLDLKLTLIQPWNTEAKKLPLVVFVQGSAWGTPNFDYEIPQLALLAHQGFVVATVGHRDCREGHLFPAFLQDVKCAIRYLRKNADQYGIDPNRVQIWGTSSGGNAAMLVGLTGDDPAYETDEHAGFSDAVDAVVNCFGPNDMVMLSEYLLQKNPDLKTVGATLSGSFDPAVWLDTAKRMSPAYQVQPDKSYPPFLLLNGTADDTVLPEQMEVMVQKLLDVNASVEAYYVDGAEHEGNFWSPEVRKVIFDFLLKHR